MNSPNTDFIIFGGTGDLSIRKLMPALYLMYADGNISTNSRIIAAARSDMSNTEFRNLVFAGLKKHLSPEYLDKNIWSKFKELLEYKKISAANEEDWRDLNQFLAAENTKLQIYYMAVPPAIFAPICHNLKKFQLNAQNSRIVVEKPLGEDLQTSREINNLIAEAFPEKRIYRIDHYLGKKSVHNLLNFRFQNEDLNKIWNKDYIESITIRVAEIVGVEGRFEMLDKIGVLRDMVQNHMLQILSLLTMAKPKTDNADDIRNEKTKILNSLYQITANNIKEHVIRAQYTEGIINGKNVPSYQAEINGHAKGTGNTFVAIKTFIENNNWQDVPIFLITGKRLNERKAEIIIKFKKHTQEIIKTELFPKLEISLQPDIYIKPTRAVDDLFAGKCPLSPSNKNKRIPDGYERLLIDVINEDQTYFVRRDEIEASWKWIDSIRKSWHQIDLEILTYPAGSYGPKKLDELLQGK